MSGLLGNKVAKLKLEVKTRYLAGEPVPAIARSFKVSTRNIYYHLGTLTPDEKALHAKNSALHGIKAKQDRKGVGEDGKVEKPFKVKEGTYEVKDEAKSEDEDSLADFIKD